MDTTASSSQGASPMGVNDFPGAIRYNPNWKNQKKGDAVVRKWQISLQVRAYKDLKADGVFGPKTYLAVNDWQTRRPQARNVDVVGDREMWRDLVTNTAPYHWGPCSSWLCPAKGKPAGMASAEEEVDLDELAEQYDLETLLARYESNGAD